MNALKKADKAQKLREKLPFRKGVGAIIFNPAGLVWAGCRIPRVGQDITDYWQMPQGGIDKRETPEEAVLREVKEETGTDKVEIFDRTAGWINYDLPNNLIGVAWKGKYRGQTQRWFALRFTGNDEDFNLNTHRNPEFSEWRWIDLAGLPELIVPFKRDLYMKLAVEFRDWPKKIRGQSK